MQATNQAKALISATAAARMVGPFVFDIYNESSPPHAKFHNAQTMSSGVALSVATLVKPVASRLWACGRGRGSPFRVGVLGEPTLRVFLPRDVERGAARERQLASCGSRSPIRTVIGTGSYLTRRGLSATRRSR